MESIAMRARTVPWPVERTIRPPSDVTRQPGAVAPRRRCMHAKLQIAGMTCVAEAIGIEQRLFHETGVIHASVSPDTGIAYVIYDHERIQTAMLRHAIEQEGFAVEAI